MQGNALQRAGAHGLGHLQLGAADKSQQLLSQLAEPWGQSGRVCQHAQCTQPWTQHFWKFNRHRF